MRVIQLTSWLLEVDCCNQAYSSFWDHSSTGLPGVWVFTVIPDAVKRRSGISLCSSSHRQGWRLKEIPDCGAAGPGMAWPGWPRFTG